MLDISENAKAQANPPPSQFTMRHVLCVVAFASLILALHSANYSAAIPACGVAAIVVASRGAALNGALLGILFAMVVCLLAVLIGAYEPHTFGVSLDEIYVLTTLAAWVGAGVGAMINGHLLAGRVALVSLLALFMYVVWSVF